jgi:hypothetical protein
MRLRPTFLLLFISLFLTISSPDELTAQTTISGGLTGVVTDQSNAVISGAQVEIQDNFKGTSQAVKTDEGGVYRLFFLAPAKYTLTVSLAGFCKESRTVNVLLGPPGTVNVTLKIATGKITVEVTGAAPLIQAESGDVSATVNANQISEVPNPGNDLTYIAQTVPGAVMNTDGQFGASQFVILGMPSSTTLFAVDGMNENDNGSNTSLSGPLGLVLGQNQIQEATVVSTGYSGQFGGAAGANANYLTKSGGNVFHGNAQYFWNGRVFNANNWFNNAFGTPRPFDNANQWAGSFGGPIKRDKLFFFFDSEGLRLVIPQPSLVIIPSPQFESATITNIDSRFGPASASDAFYKKIFNLYNATPGAGSAANGGLANDPTGCGQFLLLGPGVPCARHFLRTLSHASTETLISGRVDWNIGKNDRTFVRLQYDSGLGAFYADPISPIFDAASKMRWWQGQFIETHTFSSSAASQFIVAGTYFSAISETRDPSQALRVFPTVLNLMPLAFSNLGGMDNVFAPGLGRRNTQYQLSEDVVKTWDSQKIGIGAHFAQIYWSELPNQINVSGYLSPLTLDAFYQGGVDPSVLAGTDQNPDFTELSQSFTSQAKRPISFLSFGLYAQDEWHARANLTLTLAVRTEHYSNPVCRNRCFARLSGPFESVSHDPDQPYNQAILINQERALEGTDSILWSPRFSFAWQPLGVVRNTVLRGGVGLFYQPLPGLLLDSFSSNAPIYNSYTTSGNNLTPNETTSLFRDAADSNASFLSGFAAGETLAEIQSAIPNFSAPAINSAKRTMHSPQYQRWSLEWQQAFGVGTSLSIGYFGHHGIHELIQNPNANAFGFGSLPAGHCTSPPVLPCADPRFSEALEFSTDAMSNYNGMVFSFSHQFAAWAQGVFQANYMYGHAFDETSNGGLFGFTTVSLLSPQDPNNLRGAYGSAEYDVRHSFNATYVLEIPLKGLLRGRGPDSLVKGWQISGAIFARSGFPYTVTDQVESSVLARNNYFGSIYSVPVGPLSAARPCGKGAAVPSAPSPCLPPQLLADSVTPNPSALFLQSGCETGFNTGNLGPAGMCNGPSVSFAQGRNHFRGPGYFNTDFAIMKSTKVPHWENAVVRIGFQFFNLFNHPNFGLPDTPSSDSIFGQIVYLEQSPTSILGSGLGGDAAPRMIQLKAELRF